MAKRPARSTTPPPAADRLFAQMVLIDQRPLRSEAGAECQEAMARLEKARTIWHRFERKDKPAFIRWRAREFGALLSKARDVEVQIRENETLVYEVEMEMRRTIIDPHSAYQRVMFRRANPTAAEGTSADRGADSGRRVTEFEQEALFQDWVKKFIGTNPDKMDDEAYDASFHAFKSHMFASRKEEPAPNENRRASQPRRAEVEREIVPPVDARVKELYRLLVRRLHPDLRSDGNAAVSSLWHEVQEAYALADVGRMEILLALSDIQSNAVGDQTTLAQMRLVREELDRALDALQRSLHEAGRDDAWDFARKGADDTLRREVQRELERNLVVRTARLATLQKIISEWADPPGSNRRITRVRAFA
ncbi:MAG TPA: J domain-containing protein [Chthoniobacterales bacterium]